MVKFLKLAISEMAVLFGTGLMDWLVGDDFPGWIWGIALGVCLGILIFLYWREGKRAVVRHFFHNSEERIGIKEEWEAVLTKADGTVETHRSDGTVTVTRPNENTEEK